MLLVGSLYQNLGRQVNDVDLICRPEDLETVVRVAKPSKVVVADDTHLILYGANVVEGVKNSIVEIELAWPQSTGEEILLAEESREYISEAGLYWLKMSHRFKKDTPHFEKTRNDILLLRRRLTPDEQLHYPTWYNRRLKETLEYNHPSLKPGTTKDGFFNGDGVRYYFDHDWIHTVVARICGNSDGTPAYTLYKKDGEEVACDRRKFFSLSEETRLRGVTEEAMVLALERSQIPRRLDAEFNKSVDAEWSFKYALQKVCTSITSGWFREYAWEHYDEALASYNKNYVEEFWRTAGEV